jgi:hypothetical protein
MSMDQLKKEYVPLVKKACEDISKRLGYDTIESKTE